MANKRGKNVGFISTWRLGQLEEMREEHGNQPRGRKPCFLKGEAWSSRVNKEESVERG